MSKVSLRDVDDNKILKVAGGLIDSDISKVKNMSGAHKHVILAKDKSKNLYAICVCPIEKKEMFLSGMKIRKTMNEGGFLTPKSLAYWEEGGFVIEVQEGMKGIDFEDFMHEMDDADLMNMAREISGVVKKSSELFSDISRNNSRWGRHNINGKAPFGDLKRGLLNTLNLSIDMAMNKNDISYVLMMKKLRSFVKSTSHIHSPRQTFVWDVVTRNLIVKDGKLSGIVDQDTVKSSDLMMVPAYAHSCMASCKFKRSDEYVNEWLNSWDVSEREYSRFLIQRAAAAHYRQSKAGHLEWDGRVHKSIDAENLILWTEEALRVNKKYLEPVRIYRPNSKKRA